MKDNFGNWEEKEQNFYKQYDRFFRDYKEGDRDSFLNLVFVPQAFKLNIGCCFFYFIFTDKRDWDNAKLMYREGNFDINKYKNTYLYDFVYRLKLNNLFRTDEFRNSPFLNEFILRELRNDYYNNSIYSDDLKFYKIKGFECSVSCSCADRLLTLKAIPSQILQPLILPKEQFVFNQKEKWYVNILKESTGLFFLRNWNFGTQNREYYFFAGGESANINTHKILQVLNKKYNCGVVEKLNENEINCLCEMKIYRFIFNNNRCIIEEYNWDKDYSFDFETEGLYRLRKKNGDLIECSRYFESFIAGSLIFSIGEFFDDDRIMRVIDEAINGFRIDSSSRTMNLESPINPFHFNLYLDKEYSIRAHINEIVDRNRLYYSLKSYTHQDKYHTLFCFLDSCNKQSLDAISDNTFINLTNREISSILYRYLKSNKELLKVYKERYHSSGIYIEAAYDTIVYPNNISFNYEYNEYEDNEYASPRKYELDMYDLNCSFRNELIHRVFYDDRCGYRFE